MAVGRSVTAREAEAAGIRVLIVDDDADHREVFRRMLRLAGALVFSASSVDEAVREVDDVLPDVVVCDLRMPELDGFDFIVKLRQDAMRSAAGDLPAIAVSAALTPEAERRALRAGYQLALAKPVARDDLVSAVSTLARRSRGRRAPPGPDARPEPRPPFWAVRLPPPRPSASLH